MCEVRGQAGLSPSSSSSSDLSSGTFFLVHLLPGNPTVTILGPNDTPHNVALVDDQLGLNKPLCEQYFIWMGNVLQGNLGQSFVTHETGDHHHRQRLSHRHRADRHLPD